MTFWLSVFLAMALLKREIRKPLGNLAKTMISRWVLTCIAAMISYIWLIVWILHQIKLWDHSQLKETLIWGITVAWISLFNMPKTMEDNHYFSRAILNSFKIAVVISYIIDTYVFSLTIELFLFPLLVALAAMIAVSETDSKYAHVRRFLNGIWTLLALVLFGFIIYYLIVDIRNFARLKTLRDIILSPLLSILLMPFIYVMALYMQYQEIFVRLSFFVKDPVMVRYAKNRIFMLHKANLKRLNEFSHRVCQMNYGTKEEIDEIICQSKSSTQ